MDFQAAADLPDHQTARQSQNLTHWSVFRWES